MTIWLGIWITMVVILLYWHMEDGVERYRETIADDAARIREQREIAWKAEQFLAELRAKGQ